MRLDQPIGQCLAHGLNLSHCPECGPNKPQPLAPRGDTSGRRDPLLSPMFWSDAWMAWHSANWYHVRLYDKTEWRTIDGREWVCIRGPR